MARFTIKASITTDVELSVEAGSPDEARKIFDDQIAMTASLTEIEAADYDVSDDCITDIQNIRVDAE